MMDNTQNISKYNIIIIGAGIAGLSTAYHLIKNGFNDFIVLEARKRVGGRILPLDIGNTKVELGANWIHGVLGNPIYEFAMQYGLVDIMHLPKPHKLVAATEKGRQVPFTVLQEVYEAYLCFLHRCEEYFISPYSPPDGIDSVGSHIRLEVNLYLDKIKNPEDRHLRKLIFECLLKRETCISGCDNMNEIDLFEIGSYTELQGGNIILPNGYSSILEPFSREIPPDMILNLHPVDLIKWRNSSSSENGDDSDDSDKTVIDGDLKATSVKKKSKHNIEITCANGRQFHCDLVVCTIPLGVLKHKADEMFQPPLPKYKLEAIQRLLFGTVDKIILEYDRPFLNPNITEILLLWDQSSTERTEEDIKVYWYKKIYSFMRVTDTVLLGWISGKEAEYMETLSNDVVIDTCTNILRSFLNDPFIPKPKTCVCTTWASQPYTRGSYTSIAVGASQIDIDFIAQPILDENNKHKILFAGEHTHTTFYSTVHGAFLTGRSAAQTILNEKIPSEVTLDCDDETTDLSSWIQGIGLG